MIGGDAPADKPAFPGAPQYLMRKQAAEFIPRHFAPMSFSRLEKLCMAGEGPPVAGWWGRRPLYEPVALLEWARSRMSRSPVPENGALEAA